MPQSKVELCVCRFRKTLPTGQGKVTIGGGCVINLDSNFSAQESNSPNRGHVFLITTNQVVTMEDLVSTNNGLSIEFLDGRKLLSFDLECKNEPNIPGPTRLSGRTLDESAEAKELQEVSFVIIPVKKFDKRNVIKKTFLPFSLERKRPITCSYQSGADIRSSISKRQVLCHVICDDRRSDGSYNTEPYCLEVCTDTNEFSLTSPLSREHAEVIKSFKDFHKEEKPRGALLIDSEGKFMGMLGMARSDERKLVPLFLPIQGNLETQQYGEGDQAVSPVSEGTPPDQATTSKDDDSQKCKIRSTADGDQNTGNGCCTSVVQGSSNTDTSSLLVVDLPKPSCSTENQTISNSLPSTGQILDPELHSGQQQQQQQEDDHEVVQLFDGMEASFSNNSSLEQQEDDHEVVQLFDGMEASFSNNSSLELNEDVHPENSGPKLATQNSYCGQSLSSEYDYGVPETGNPPPDKAEPSVYPLKSSSESVNGQRSLTEADRVGFKRSQSDMFGPGTPSQTRRGSTVPRCNTSNMLVKQLRHITAGSLVKDNVVSQAEIMDLLSLHLDRSVIPCRGVTQRWEHLADKFKVPDEIKRRCENFTGNHLSPSEAMFEVLYTTHGSLTVEKLKGYLRKLGRNDVIHELEKNINLKDEQTVTDLFENHPETLCRVCLKLDDKRSIKNWHDLGIEIGINVATLRRLKDPSGSSPSEAVLRKIQTLKPRLSISKLAENIKLPAIVKVLGTFPDGSTIETLFNEIDIFEQVTAILDLDEKAWQRLGRGYGIDVRVLDNLKPDSLESPTKVVMEYIVQTEPALTMKKFLKCLESIDRFDVIADLKDFFYANDIDEILQAEGPVPL